MSGVRCTRCDFETQEPVSGSACPFCGDEGIPMDPARDLRIRVNWHELRILVMWAMNWAARADDPPSGARAVAAIARRLAHQKPDPSWPGLTMADDLVELSEWAQENAGGMKVVGGTDPRGKGEHVVWPGSWTLGPAEDTEFRSLRRIADSLGLTLSDDDLRG